MPDRFPHHPHPGWAAGKRRNRWPLTVGTGGRLTSESVAGMDRNTHVADSRVDIECEALKEASTCRCVPRDGRAHRPPTGRRQSLEHGVGDLRICCNELEDGRRAGFVQKPLNACGAHPATRGPRQVHEPDCGAFGNGQPVPRGWSCRRGRRRLLQPLESPVLVRAHFGRIAPSNVLEHGAWCVRVGLEDPQQFWMAGLGNLGCVHPNARGSRDQVEQSGELTDESLAQ